ncbi:MAG: hypothetical protein CL840_08175 [Crocinitomicaceae bacterium]|nr:hypothetical protein [Crocinitomicaceae bacterium]|tara:strand:+ start:38766 stop:39170 length:405 start_codon:yes stop_codon:yes gene_type:complete
MAEKFSKIALVVFLLLGAMSFVGSMFFEQYNFMIYLCYIYAIIAIIGALAGGIMGAMAKPESVKGNVIGIVGMGVVLGISYALGNGEVLEVYPEGTSSTAVKWSDTGLYMLYIIGSLSIVSVLYAGVAQLLNKN